MRFSERCRSTRQMIEAIEGLDLGPIKFKLMDPQEGEGWGGPSSSTWSCSTSAI